MSRALGWAAPGLGGTVGTCGCPLPPGPQLGFIPHLGPGCYSLSVRDFDTQNGDTVKHYKIRTLDNGGFYISPRNSFSTLIELVDHYKSEALHARSPSCLCGWEGIAPTLAPARQLLSPRGGSAPSREAAWGRAAVPHAAWPPERDFSRPPDPTR